MKDAVTHNMAWARNLVLVVIGQMVCRGLSLPEGLGAAAAARLRLGCRAPGIDGGNTGGPEWHHVASRYRELARGGNRRDLRVRNGDGMAAPAGAHHNPRVGFRGADVERHDPLAEQRHDLVI